MGPKPVSTVLTAEADATAVVFRQHTLLPLDDCLYALQEIIPPLSRSALHRLFQRHGTRRLPAPAPAWKRKKFKDYPMGYLHVDFAEVHTEEGRVYPFVSIDRTSQLAFAGLQPRATKILAADFLRRVLAAIPHKAPKVLTDNGTQFGNMPHQVYAWRDIFDRVCDEHGTEHRFTKPAHPWPTDKSSASTARSKGPPCSAIITRPRPNSTTMCKSFCWPPTTANDSSACGVKPRTSLSASSGTSILLSLSVTPPTSPWDQTDCTPR